VYQVDALDILILNARRTK